MKNLGYSNMTKSFLVKNINGIDINITRRNNAVESIVGYQKGEIVPIPEDVLAQVKNDIQQSL